MYFYATKKVVIIQVPFHSNVASGALISEMTDASFQANGPIWTVAYRLRQKTFNN